ncbi:MAG TPA: CAP domain-containing protein [Mycobacteriales bacterium]
MLRRVFVLLALLLPLTFVSATPAQASATESEFVSRANSARTSRGLRAYPVRSDLVSVARRQAARMAAARRIYHNPNLTSEVSNWRNVGENVGRGGSVSAIHSAFMGSSGHRANILSTTFVEIGVGTARGSDGLIYVSEVFRRPAGYVPPATAPATTSPTRTTRTTRTTYTRASRSAVRRPLPPARPVVVVRRPPAKPASRLLGRVRAAYALYRTPRPPVGSIGRAVAYVRAATYLTA